MRTPYEALELPWHERPDPAAIAQREFTHLAMVHHETSTGILNPLAEVAALCRERGAPLILDAISSFAGIPVETADVMLASANKCLQGMPGISMVFVRRDLFDSMTALLREAARSGKLALVFDDLHRADADSLELLRFVMTEVEGEELVMNREKHTANGEEKASSHQFRRDIVSVSEGTLELQHGETLTTCSRT